MHIVSEVVSLVKVIHYLEILSVFREYGCKLSAKSSPGTKIGSKLLSLVIMDKTQ